MLEINVSIPNLTVARLEHFDRNNYETIWTTNKRKRWLRTNQPSYEILMSPVRGNLR